jgi:hypothetical protein
MKNKKKEKVKQVKKAIGRLRVPPTKVVPNKKKEAELTLDWTSDWWNRND